jgi:hypothetical protein
MTPRAKTLLLSAATGAAVSAAVAYVLKGQLERQFGAGARELEAHLTDRGSALRATITAEAAVAGRQAALRALNDYGITPRLVSQIQTLANMATRLTS